MTDAERQVLALAEELRDIRERRLAFRIGASSRVTRHADGRITHDPPPTARQEMRLGRRHEAILAELAAIGERENADFDVHLTAIPGVGKPRVRTLPRGALA